MSSPPEVSDLATNPAFNFTMSFPTNSECSTQKELRTSVPVAQKVHFQRALPIDWPDRILSFPLVEIQSSWPSSTNDIRNRDFDILILKTTPRACGGRILLLECFLTFSIDKRESLYR